MHHTFEADVVDAGGHGHFAVRTREMPGQQDRPALHGRFAQQHAGHQGMARIMAREEILLAAESLDADDPRVAPLDDLVDQQKRVAVRNGGEDFLLIHAVELLLMYSSRSA